MKKFILILMVPMPMVTFCSNNALADTDITRIVINTTDLDDKIRNTCNRYCQGNKKKGILRRVTIRPLGNDIYKVSMWSDFINKHWLRILHGGFYSYDWTINVNAEGELNRGSCVITVNRINVDPDRFGLGNLAKREEGRQHVIQNCKRFIAN